jgi:hypothetical protein
MVNLLQVRERRNAERVLWAVARARFSGAIPGFTQGLDSLDGVLKNEACLLVTDQGMICLSG